MGFEGMYVNGRLVFADGQRWYLAVGDNVCQWEEHFVALKLAANAPYGWTTTRVGATTIATEDGAGGLLLITTAGAENDGANLQVVNEAFKLAAGKPCYFGIRFKISDATQSDFLLGLCITDTDLLGGLSDGVYFRKVDGSTAITSVIEKDTSETESGTLLACDTDRHTYELIFDGSVVDFWVDGVAQTRLAQTNLPDDEDLTPSIHVLTGDNAVITAEVDWIRTIQIL